MKRLALIVLLLGSLGSLGAHECWLQPSTFAPAPGTAVRLSIQVGMEFKGETRPFSPARVAALKHFSATGRDDWTSQVAPALDFPASFTAAGTHVVAYDSKPSFIEFDAEKFHEYLREAGLDAVIAERERAGETAKPGRERYQRCIKSILTVAGSDGGYALLTGQRLEIIPLDDPFSIKPGRTLRFKVLFEHAPLTGAKIRAWHRQGDKLTTLDARTSAWGEASFTLPLAGEWMISTIYMARVTGDAAADWESYWGNLTLVVNFTQ